MSDQVEGTEVPEGVQPHPPLRENREDDVEGHRRAYLDGDDQPDAGPEGLAKVKFEGDEDVEGHAYKSNR